MPEAVLSGPYADAFTPDPTEPAWLRDARREAFARFLLAGFPGPKDERFRNTDLQAFTQEQPVDGAGTAPDTLPRFDGVPRFVLRDGRFDIDLSDDAPDGVEVLSLRDATRTEREEARVHLGNAVDPDAFSDLNTALWADGVFVNVLPGTQAPPIHILHVRTGDGVSFPRVLVHVQRTGKATVVEQAIGPATGLTIAVTELCAHDGATLRHDLLQETPGGAHYLHTVAAVSERDATVAQGNVSLGAAHARTTVTARLAEEGASVDLNGLYLGAGTQRTDQWTHIDHAVPHGTSRELYKGILDDESRGGFTGNILVRPGAQKTASQQENRNLLLSRGALADATPQLEIHADDVKCSHGSTVGQLDEGALFFLRSRGIGRNEATRMLTHAFAAEVIERLSLPAVRDHVAWQIEAWFARRGQEGAA